MITFYKGAHRERMLRDYELSYQLDELLDSTGYPRGLSYPPEALDTLQTIALAEACGARRAREEIEMDEMKPILRRLGRNDFDGVGLGGLGWDRMGDGLGVGRGLDRLYHPMLRNQGLGLDTIGGLMLPGMIDHARRRMAPNRGGAALPGLGMGYGGLDGMGMGALRSYPGMGLMRRRRPMGMGGMGPYSPFSGICGYPYGGPGMSSLS
jgi:hypothetical protein